jgi:hypothetical protein
MQRGNCGRNNYDADLRAVALIVFDHKFAVGGGGQSFRLVKGAPRSVLKGSENRHEHCGLCVECAETRHQAIKPSSHQERMDAQQLAGGPVTLTNAPQGRHEHRPVGKCPTGSELARRNDARRR